MPPDPRMKVFESSKRAGWFGKVWALGITSVIDETNSIEAEFRHIKEAIINWHKRHGHYGQTLMLVFEAQEQKHEKIIEYTSWALNTDVHLYPILKNIQSKFIVVDAESKMQREFQTTTSSCHISSRRL
jgi:hypothetical protein